MGNLYQNGVRPTGNLVSHHPLPDAAGAFAGRKVDEFLRRQSARFDVQVSPV
jgi:hypothetical protein